MSPQRPKIQFLIPPTFATFSPTQKNPENHLEGDNDIVASRQRNPVEMTTRISGTLLHVSPSTSRASRLLKSVSRHFLSPIHGFTHSALQKQEYADRVDLFVNAVPGPAGRVVCAFVLSGEDLELLRLCMDGGGGAEDGQDTELDGFRKRLMNLFELGCNGEKSMNVKTTAVGHGFASTQTDVDGFFDLQLCWSLDAPSSSHLNLTPSKRECHVAVFTATKANNGEEIDHFQLLSLPLLEKYPEERQLCVISDIDDTIKETKVYQGLLKTLKTSLLEPLEQVPGMSDLFNTLLTNSSTTTSASASSSLPKSSQSTSAPSTTTFHYVSAGPTLFQPPILQFLTQNNFPTTSLSLRRRPRSKKPQSTLLYKTEVIVDLLERLGINGGGKREFLLFGDEGEADALVYKNVVEWAVAERLKSGLESGIQIKGVFIRRLPKSKCQSTADTIAADLDGYGKDHLDLEEERVELKFEDSVEADDGDERKAKCAKISSGLGPEVRFFQNGFDLAQQLSTVLL